MAQRVHSPPWNQIYGGPKLLYHGSLSLIYRYESGLASTFIRSRSLPTRPTTKLFVSVHKPSSSTALCLRLRWWNLSRVGPRFLYRKYGAFGLIRSWVGKDVGFSWNSLKGRLGTTPGDVWAMRRRSQLSYRWGIISMNCGNYAHVCILLSPI